MRRPTLLLSAATLALFVAPPLVVAHEASEEMAAAAKNFLAALSAEQKAKVSFAFDAKYEPPVPARPARANAAPAPKDERTNWHFIPRARKGLPIKEMTQEQRLLAHALLANGLSHRGYSKAISIMSLESVLAILEKDRRGGAVRDPELYFFSIFGTPGQEPWGWRFEGHHLALNFTSAGGAAPAMTPSFFGTNPGEVKDGPRAGTRILGTEEDLGRKLAKSLTEEQRKKAVILPEAPRDILNVPGRSDTKPEGIAWPDLNDAQRATLKKLLHEYVFRHRPDVAADALARLAKGGMDKLHFAWAGGFELGQPHYYRVQAGNFVLEYDNTQNGANHVHSLWREFDRDFGADLLGEHYKAAHGR